MLPCGGYHVKEFEETKNFKKNCYNRKNLRKFILNAHNSVNKHQNKPKWNLSEVEEKYSMNPYCETNNNKWSSDKSL